MNAFELRQMRDSAPTHESAAIYELCAQLAELNEKVADYFQSQEPIDEVQLKRGIK